jgi:GcrA cell cycle regulator
VENPWPPERVELLVSNRIAGKSTRYLAALLGTTRNSVLGKLHRLGLVSKEKRAVANQSPHVPPARKPIDPAPPIYNPKSRKSRAIGAAARNAQDKYTAMAESGDNLKQFSSAEGGVAIADLKDRHCRWPCANGGKVTTHFCGADKAENSSYCEEHALKSIDVESRRRRAARRKAVEQFRSSAP